MAKKIMGKFLTILGFEDREGEPVEEPVEEPTPYNPPGRGTGVQRPPVRQRIGEPSGQTAPIRRMDERTMPIAQQSQTAAGMRMVVYQPQSYDDTQRIIDDLKSGRPVIANLEDLNVEIAQRVLDFLSGAVYGLDGSIRKVSRGIFLLAPPHVDISGNILSSLSSDLRGGRSSYFNLPRRPE